MSTGAIVVNDPASPRLMGLRGGRRVAGVVSTVALILMAWTGAVLTWRYRPDGGGPASEVTSSAAWSRRLVDWHQVSFLLAAAALVAWGGLALASEGGRARHTAAVVTSTVGALAMAAATAVAWTQVRWVQLGLWAVTVGDHVQGLWYAAFSDQVRFVLVDGSGEHSPSDLAPWVVVHLVAPFMALAAFAAGVAAARPARGPRRSVVAPDAETSEDQPVR